MITVSNLRAGYATDEVLHGVSFALARGERLSVIGPNGCGKTTLLRALAGTLPLSGGSIAIDGVDIRQLKRKTLAKKVAMLSQTTQLYFSYTVYDTVMMGRYVHEKGGIFGGSTAGDKEVVEKALTTVGMLDEQNREVDTLSGGQLQRVFLAKLIAQDPDIILLDEPTNHLDLRYQVELLEFLREWAETEGKTVIGVLHDITLSMRLSDTVMLLGDGEVKAYGTRRQVFSSAVVSQVYAMDVAGYMLGSLKQWQDIVGQGPE